LENGASVELTAPCDQILWPIDTGRSRRTSRMETQPSAGLSEHLLMSYRYDSCFRVLWPSCLTAGLSTIAYS